MSTSAGSRQVVVLGAGGHAKVVVSTLRAAGFEVMALYDKDPTKAGQELLGVRIRPQEELPRCGQAVIGIGGNGTRRRLEQEIKALEWLTVIHPGACVDPSVKLGPGTVVFAGAVIQPDSVVGSHVIVNTAATIDHDCVVGDFAHLAPGVHLAGDVHVGAGSFLGVGAVTIPGTRIGSWTTVGAGGVVVRNLPDGVKAVGVPAKPHG